MSGLEGLVQTVLGPVSPDTLGRTMMHEHLVLDGRARATPPPSRLGPDFAIAPVTPSLRADIVHHPFTNLDDMLLDSEEIAIEELLRYKRAGGGTIVDTTTAGLKRDPHAIRRIAAATGLNITMGAGYYAYMFHPPDMDARTEDEILEEIVSDILVGIDGIRAGHIGEIACEGITPNELKVLRAAARAQRRTGAMLSIHQIWRPGDRDSLRLIADTIESVGGDLNRTVFGHMDRTGMDPDMQIALLERGITIEYDVFGYEVCHDDWDREPPQDVQRILDFARLIDAGWVAQLVMAQDICFKTMQTHFGGHGYAHILERVVPGFRARGVSEEAIDTMLIDNPRRLLTFTSAQSG